MTCPNHDIFYDIQLSGCCVGLLLHSVGIFSILSNSRKKKQTFILLSLSCCDIGLLGFGGFWAAFHIIGDQNVEADSIYAKISYIVHEIGGFQILFSMHLLSTDSFQGVSSHSYGLQMTDGRMKLMLLVSWVISITLGIVKEMVVSTVLAMYFIRIAIAILYLILVIVIYSIVFYRTKISPNRSLGNNSQENIDEQIELTEEWKTATIIMVNFFVLLCVPEVIKMVISYDCIVAPSLMIASIVGLSVHPLIYILSTRRYRNQLMLRCFTRQQPSLSNTESNRHVVTEDTEMTSYG